MRVLAFMLSVTCLDLDLTWLDWRNINFPAIALFKWTAYFAPLNKNQAFYLFGQIYPLQRPNILQSINLIVGG